jgi:hypothetical protein
MAKIRNAFDYNHIAAILNRSTGEWSYILNILGTGKEYPGSIVLTHEQFSQLEEELELKSEPSLDSDTGKVYIINP